MDRPMLTAPMVSDREALDDFVDALRDIAPAIERDVARLRSAPGERQVIASLFRSLHNIKGDAALCKVDLAVAIVHPIETVLARVRSGVLPFTEPLAEIILLTVDRLELAMARIAVDEALDDLQLWPLIDGLERLAGAAPADVDECAAEVFEVVTGFRPVFAASLATRGALAGGHADSSSAATEDLRFFLKLANQFELRSPLFKGRTTRILRLALETNQIVDDPIDPLQLEAAVYMHDVGMMFLAESVWLKASDMSTAEKVILHAHPGYAAGLLARMPGWAAAAEMVAQHHEAAGGAGYPAALESAQICAGGKLLAICDAFEAVMLKHINRGRNRSLLRAIAEINACDKQFASEWIVPFNQVIRRSVEAR